MMQKAHLLNQQLINEMKLFHGTSPENVEAICEKNFDPQIHKNNRTLMLGQGTYFAVNAVTSDSYAKKDSNLFQYMFLAKVLVGSYIKAHGPCNQSLSPEEFANVDPRLYNWRADNIANPTIFVVFDRNHFYPEYVIQYSSAKSPFGRSLLLKKRSAQYLTPSSSTQSRFHSASALSGAELTGTTVAKCSDNLSTASLPSDPAAQTESSDSASTVSRAELTDTTPTKCLRNPDTASLPSDSAAQSSDSASTVSGAELTDTIPTKCSGNPDTASLPSDSAAQSSDSASTVSGAELTDTIPTKCSGNPGTASLKAGTVVESSYSLSALFSSELVSVETRLNAQIILHAEVNCC